MFRLFLLALVTLSVCRAEAAPKFQPIVIALGDIFDVTGNREAEPLRRLCQSLKRHPKTEQFRLIWSTSAPNMGQSATALYDRKTRALRFYSNTQIGGLGNEAVAAEIKHWILSGVTETMLDKLAHKYRGAPTASDGASYFSEMIGYGARWRDLGSRQVLSSAA